MYYIGIEDLAANALIELLSKSMTGKVSFKALDLYGVAVVKALRKDGNDAILLLSRERTKGFIRECSDLLEIDDPDSKDASIFLREGFTEKDLINRFCGSISIPVLRAMAAEESVNALLRAVA